MNKRSRERASGTKQFGVRRGCYCRIIAALVQIGEFGEEVGLGIIGVGIIGQPKPIAPAAPNAPTIFLETVLLHDPMVSAPARSLRGGVSTKDQPTAIVVMT